MKVSFMLIPLIVYTGVCVPNLDTNQDLMSACAPATETFATHFDTVGTARSINREMENNIILNSFMYSSYMGTVGTVV